MTQNETIEVTNQEGNKMKIEISWESDVWKWVDTFKVILKWLDFPAQVIEKALKREE